MWLFFKSNQQSQQKMVGRHEVHEVPNVDEKQVDIFDKIISDLVKNLYTLDDQEMITYTKIKLMQSILAKNKNPPDDHPVSEILGKRKNVVESEKPEKQEKSEKSEKSEKPVGPSHVGGLEEDLSLSSNDILYKIIDEALTEASFRLDTSRAEIFGIIQTYNSQRKLLTVKIPITIIDLPKSIHLFKFVKLVQSFFTEYESLDIIIPQDDLKFIENGTDEVVLQRYNWKYARVQQGIDNFIKMCETNSSEQKNPRIMCSKYKCYQPIELSIRLIGNYDDIITINIDSAQLNIKFLKKYTGYKIKGNDYVSGATGVLKVQICEC
jgi:hypothetical protein